MLLTSPQKISYSKCFCPPFLQEKDEFIVSCVLTHLPLNLYMYIYIYIYILLLLFIFHRRFCVDFVLCMCTDSNWIILLWEAKKISWNRKYTIFPIIIFTIITIKNNVTNEGCTARFLDLLLTLLPQDSQIHILTLNSIHMSKNYHNFTVS